MDMFSDLKNCERMYIRRSNMREVGLGLHSLTHLYFSYNDHLKLLTPGMFGGLVAIHALLLNNNGINSIEDGTFVTLKTLQILWLHGNELEALRPRMFFGLESLETLCLDFNYLTTLPEDVFTYLPRPLEIALYDFIHYRIDYNHLQCDADLCWLKMEELEGTITWHEQPRRPIYKPRCGNGVDWDNWTCDDIGIR